MFLHELGPIESEAFLTLASEIIEDDGIVDVEEAKVLDQYAKDMRVYGFSYDAAACNAARDTLAQLPELLKRKVYMELFSVAICDSFEDVNERRTLNSLRDAFGFDNRICRALESCVLDLYSVYAAIDEALTMPATPASIAKEIS